MSNELKSIFSAGGTGDGIERSGILDDSKRAAIRAGFVRANLGRLPAKYRPVMRARYVDKLTTEAAAAKLGLSKREAAKLERDGLNWLRLKIELK